jgi:ATP-dependent DNA helicase DinG
MAEAVARSLAADYPLLIEAGTGIGKTLAYLLPILWALSKSGGRTVVATHTRALQNQILAQDLPRLKPLFPQLRARLLMGRQNYLCRRQQDAFLARPVTTRAEGLAAATFRLWLATTTEGMREELADHPVLSSRLHVWFDSPEPCSPTGCYEDNGCYVQRARREAREADLLVVNHALLMHDLAADNTLLGPFRHLVVDEAHRLPQVALDTHALRCDQRPIRDIQQLLGASAAREVAVERRQGLVSEFAEAGAPSGAAEAYDGFLEAGGRCCDEFQRWWRALDDHLHSLWPEGGAPAGRYRIRDDAETFGPVRSATQQFLARAAAANTAYAALAQACESLIDLASETSERLASLGQAGQMLMALQEHVRFLTGDTTEGWVVWREHDAAGDLIALGATRLEAGDLLRTYWLDSGLQPIMTSGTLAIGEDFTHMLTELGLQRLSPPVVTVLMSSPFDYEQQTLFLSLPDMPAPDQAEHTAVVAGVLQDLMNRVQRKTLALFTSYQALQKVAATMTLEPEEGELFESDLAAASGAGAPQLLVQSPRGEASNLLSRFRRLPQAILLGTTTFWEGVDFPGSDLEVLMVTKLPFQVPNDPWVEARCDRIQAGGENPFTTFMVRDAILRLRQGLGRLIRRRSDRGVVMLLDNRLHTKNYGVSFLNALPTTVHVCHDERDLVERAVTFFDTG